MQVDVHFLFKLQVTLKLERAQANGRCIVGFSVQIRALLRLPLNIWQFQMYGSLPALKISLKKSINQLSI